MKYLLRDCENYVGVEELLRRMGLEIQTKDDLINLGAMNLFALSQSPRVPEGCSQMLVSQYLEALARAEGTKDKPVFAPFRRRCPPAAYLQSEVDDVLYLDVKTGRFRHGERVEDADLSDGVINIHARPGKDSAYDPRIVYTCRQNDPFFLLVREADYLGTDAEYRSLWLKMISLRVNKLGLDRYREEIENDGFDVEVLEAALVAYGAARSRNEKPYDEFQYTGE